MQEKNSHNAINILSRLKSALNLNTDIALADYLGINQSTISTWKTRNSINYDLIIAKCNNVSLDYLIKGVGESKSTEIVINVNDNPNDNQFDKNKKYKKSNQFKEIIPLGPCQQCVSREETIKTQRELIEALREIALLKENESVSQHKEEIAPHPVAGDKKRKVLTG